MRGVGGGGGGVGRKWKDDLLLSCIIGDWMVRL